MMNEPGPEFDPSAMKGEPLPLKDIPLSEAFAVGYRDGVAFERERCAKIADTVALNAERRAVGHTNSEAKQAAFDKMQAAQEVAAFIRDQPLD